MTTLSAIENITRELLASRAAQYGDDAKSQLHQDAFVLEILGGKSCGYFVEVGAAGGVSLSNTYLLEKKFNWDGILVEPARGSHASLWNNRSAAIDVRAAWSESGKILSFMEPKDACLSSLTCRAMGDGFESARFSPTTATYSVITVSLQDLLIRHDAPRIVDYLSLDTEGSEGDILEPFDFDKHQFRIVTCEHNHNGSRRQNVKDILTRNGYRRVCESLSDFEDWYLHESVM